MPDEQQPPVEQPVTTAPVEKSAPATPVSAAEALAEKKKKEKGRLRAQFSVAAGFFKQDKGIQPAAITAGILMGTTALATPLLGTMVGAGIAMAAGMYVLTKTSDVVVDNADALGKKARISPMALGVGLGVLTSLPELFVSVGAMMAGSPAIGIGNIVGSNTANLLLILGGTAAMKKIEGKGLSWKFNAVAMCGATAVFGAQMAAGFLSPVAGGAMLAGLGGYLWKSYKVAQKDAAEEKKKPAPAAAAPNEKPSPESKMPKWFNTAWGLAGLGGLIGASSLLVSSATAFSVAVGISPVVVGVLAVAVGTSLPEMMVNFKAARKGETDMAVGNILGSNVFNLLGIGGLLALSGSTVPADLNPRAGLAGLVNSAAFGLSALFGFAAMRKNKGGLTRKQGIAGVATYGAYTAATVALGASAPPPP